MVRLKWAGLHARRAGCERGSARCLGLSRAAGRLGGRQAGWEPRLGAPFLAVPFDMPPASQPGPPLTRGVELHKLEVLQRQPRARRHGAAVAGAGVRRGGGEVGAAVAAGGKDGLVRTEAVQRAVLHAQGNHAAARAVLRAGRDGQRAEHGHLSQPLRR